MNCTGKMFGAIGEFIPAASGYAPITARPGYSSWYARQMAQSYARRSGLLRRFCGVLLAA